MNNSSFQRVCHADQFKLVNMEKTCSFMQYKILSKIKIALPFLGRGSRETKQKQNAKLKCQLESNKIKSKKSTSSLNSIKN